MRGDEERNLANNNPLWKVTLKQIEYIKQKPFGKPQISALLCLCSCLLCWKQDIWLTRYRCVTNHILILLLVIFMASFSCLTMTHLREIFKCSLNLHFSPELVSGLVLLRQFGSFFFCSYDVILFNFSVWVSPPCLTSRKLLLISSNFDLWQLILLVIQFMNLFWEGMKILCDNLLKLCHFCLLPLMTEMIFGSIFWCGYFRSFSQRCVLLFCIYSVQSSNIWQPLFLFICGIQFLLFL